VHLFFVIIFSYKQAYKLERKKEVYFHGISLKDTLTYIFANQKMQHEKAQNSKTSGTAIACSHNICYRHIKNHKSCRNTQSVWMQTTMFTMLW